MTTAKALVLPLIGMPALGGCHDEERAGTGASGTIATNTTTTLSKKETGADPVTSPAMPTPTEKAQDANTTGSMTASTPPAPTNTAAPEAGHAADRGKQKSDGKKH